MEFTDVKKSVQRDNENTHTRTVNEMIVYFVCSSNKLSMCMAVLIHIYRVSMCGFDYFISFHSNAVVVVVVTLSFLLSQNCKIVSREQLFYLDY